VRLSPGKAAPPALSVPGEADADDILQRVLRQPQMTVDKTSFRCNT
jgi:hypothetical protein